jgi:hypothetical protein
MKLSNLKLARSNGICHFQFQCNVDDINSYRGYFYKKSESLLVAFDNAKISDINERMNKMKIMNEESKFKSSN